MKQARDIQVLGIITNNPLVFEACLEGQASSDGDAFHMIGKVLDDLLAENRGAD